MFQSDLALIQSLLPPFVRGNAYIAGSAAIAPHSASDIDVWVFTTPEKGDQLETYASSAWASMRFWKVFDLTPKGSPDYPFNEDNEFYPLGIRMLGRVQVTRGLPIQFFIVTKANVSQLLLRFDISTHQWAVKVDDYPSAVVSTPTSTLPSQLPRVVSNTTPERTFFRLKRVLQRYGWDEESHPDLNELGRASSLLF